jgi:hypothetical protein
MELNDSALREACLKVAKNTVRDIKPYDTAITTNLAEAYYRIACYHVIYLVEYSDPNILIGIINNIASITIPFVENTDWFSNYLQAVIEFICSKIP